MELSNVASPADIQGMAIQLNKNSFGLSPLSQQVICNPPIPVGGNDKAAVELIVTPAMLAHVPPLHKSKLPSRTCKGVVCYILPSISTLKPCSSHPTDN
jgi:hypothetical protein